MKPWYIVYCLWRKIDAILDGPHALKLELFKETAIPSGRRLLHAYTYMVTTPFGYKLRSPASSYLHTQITSKSFFLEKKVGLGMIQNHQVQITGSATADTKMGSGTCISCTNAVTSIGGKYHRYVTRLSNHLLDRCAMAFYNVQSSLRGFPKKTLKCFTHNKGL